MATININSWTDLAKIGNDVSYPMDGDYVLTTDLSSSDGDYSGIGDDFDPIGYVSGDSKTNFTGTFDGDGHTISGLTINKPGFNDRYIGLFAYLNYAEVKNLGLINGSISGGYMSVGSIAGQAQYSTISDCYNTCDVSGGGTYLDNYIGGIVGYINYSPSIIKNCYNTGNVSDAYEYGGGICGYAYYADIENCYSVGSVNGSNTIGGVVGRVFNGTVTNCGWYTGNVDDADYAIGSSGASVDHETSDATNFYDKDYDYIAGSQDGMYRDSDGTYYWTEGSPWYWADTNYPNFFEIISYQLNPSLQWVLNGTVGLTPSLQWTIQSLVQKTPDLQWKTALGHKFVPNIINYPFYFDLPSVKESSVPMTASGCFLGYSVYMENTGSSGTTELEIYVNGVLKDTVSVTANNSTKNEIQYFDLDILLRPQDIYKVKVTSVATDASDLKVNMYHVTFPFELDMVSYSNLYDGDRLVGTNKDYLFNTADNWEIEFNQPIQAISSVTVTDENGDEESVSSSLTTGFFYNSRVQLSPYTTSDVTNIEIKVQDYKGDYHSFNLSPTISDYMSDYELYISDTSQTFDLYIPATNYRYSFDDGITWSIWTPVSADNSISVDFSDASTGANSMQFQYNIGQNNFTESVTIYKAVGDIDATIFWKKDGAEVSYNDSVPLEKLDVYYDNSLVDTLTLPLVSGFDTFSVNRTTTALDIGVGQLTLNGEIFNYDGSSWDLSDFDFSSYGYSFNYIMLFGFDTVNKDFTVKISENKKPGGDYDVNFTNFIKIWGSEVIFDALTSDFSSYSIDEGSDPEYLYSQGKINLDLNTSQNITITLTDVSGRTKDFDFTYKKLLYNIWRTLSVTKDNLVGSSYEGANYPEESIDDNSSNFWQSDTTDTLPQWIWYEFGQENKKTIVEYTLEIVNSDANSKPTDWKLQGSNDGSNWDDLDTVTGETWSGDGPKTYTVSNSTDYAYYRLYITGTSGGTYVKIREWELKDSIGGSDLMTFTENTLLPGEIHQHGTLNLDISSEDWGTEPDAPIT